jgi:hypothetical protein
MFNIHCLLFDFYVAYCVNANFLFSFLSFLGYVNGKTNRRERERTEGKLVVVFISMNVFLNKRDNSRLESGEWKWQLESTNQHLTLIVRYGLRE